MLLDASFVKPYFSSFLHEFAIEATSLFIKWDINLKTQYIISLNPWQNKRRKDVN